MQKVKIQKQLNKVLLPNEPKQTLVSEPKKYSRGKEKNQRWWVELSCEKHGAYRKPKRVNEILKQNKRCPKCSDLRGRKLFTKVMALKNGSLYDLNPNFLEEWDYERNTDTPKNIPIKSNKVFWWKCNRGHNFKQRVADRVDKGTSCTICQKHIKVSKFEMLVFSELSALFNNQVFSQYKIKNLKDIDIFIKPLNLAIEVDGYPWHLKTIKRDEEKQIQIIKKGLSFLRFRDDRLPNIYQKTVTSKLALENVDAIKVLVSYIYENYKIEKKYKKNFVNFFKNGTVGKDLFNKIMSEFPLPKSKSLKHIIKPITKTHPDIISEWGDNGLLKPEMVSRGSHIRVLWVCKFCKVEYVKSVKARCDESYGCPTCYKSFRVLNRHRNKREKGINLSNIYPKLAAEFDIKKNKCFPKDVGPGDNRKYWWNCPNCRLSYDAGVASRAKGNNCPYCSGHRVSKYNNLKKLYPKIIHIWNYKANYPKIPENYTAGSEEKIVWSCKKCGKSKSGPIRDRIDRVNKKIRSFRHQCI